MKTYDPRDNAEHMLYMQGWEDGTSSDYGHPWSIPGGGVRAQADDPNLNRAYLDGWAAGRHARNTARDR